MPTVRPPRLPAFDYIGMHRYFLTICTQGRLPVFVSAAVVDPVCAQLLHTAHNHDFAVPAFCFMRDHCHALVEALSPYADLRRWVRLFKQTSAHDHQQRHGTRLWSPGYYDHVLRSDEASHLVARYIVENPVTAGLVAVAWDYPFAGLDRWTVREIVEGAPWV